MSYTVPEFKTDKEVYEFVLAHLEKQGMRSRLSSLTYDGAVCAYRGDNGTMCAIGCLIPDDNYDYRLEGKNLNSERVRQAVPALKDSTRERASMLYELQKAHDKAVDTPPHILIQALKIAFAEDGSLA